MQNELNKYFYVGFLFFTTKANMQNKFNTIIFSPHKFANYNCQDTGGGDYMKDRP